MKLIGVGRLGRDVEVRYTSDGKAIANLSVAWNYGKPGKDGKRASQWLDAALFGERAEKLAPYLKKGTSVFLDIRDMHVETFTKQDGTTSVKLAGFVDAIEFAGDRPAQETPRKPANKFEDDSIPF